MKVKVRDAIGPVLDLLVDLSLGGHNPGTLYSSQWASGGPLIEPNWINVHRAVGGRWLASDMHPGSSALLIEGPTPLVAVCRCLVISKLGEEVDIPEKLLAFL